MKQTYKLIFIALLLLGLCVSGVQADTYLSSYDPYLKLHLAMNGTDGETTFIDSSPLHRTITAYNTTVNTTPHWFGSGFGNFLQGEKNYLSAAASDDWVMGTNPFTIHTQINLSVDQDAAIISQFDLSADTQNWLFWYWNHGSPRRLYFTTTGGATDHYVSWNPNMNQRYQIDLIRNTTHMDFYVDGVLLGSFADTASYGVSTKTLYVGREVARSDGSQLKGSLDELGFWNGVAIPITELYPQLYEIGQSTNSITADFTASNTSGVQPLLVQFTDTSTTSGATIDSWAWDFGDVNTSALQNPEYTYEIPGTYSANLTITNISYSLVSTKLVTITVYNQPVADFSSFNTAGTAPFTTYFYDTSTNLNAGPYTYYTDFGDSNTSTEQNTYFTWNITGTYDVKHCVTDSILTTCNNKTAYVTVGTATIAPVASFYGSPTTGNVPLTVSFTDVSSNTPTSWNWSFGDGIYSELQNPTHAYTRSGFKNVNLTATNSAGSNVTTRLKFVKVS